MTFLCQKKSKFLLGPVDINVLFAYFSVYPFQSYMGIFFSRHTKPDNWRCLLSLSFNNAIPLVTEALFVARTWNNGAPMKLARPISDPISCIAFLYRPGWTELLFITRLPIQALTIRYYICLSIYCPTGSDWCIVKVIWDSYWKI